jgi:polyphosphate kinase
MAVENLATSVVTSEPAPARTQPRSRIAPDAPERFFNRELSWLSFNERVFEEAGNPANPLLERLRFLSISASILDEFTMVRLAGLLGQLRAGLRTFSPDGRSLGEQLRMINKRVATLLDKQQLRW